MTNEEIKETLKDARAAFSLSKEFKDDGKIMLAEHFFELGTEEIKKITLEEL